jgi:hypothetical protein
VGGVVVILIESWGPRGRDCHQTRKATYQHEPCHCIDLGNAREKNEILAEDMGNLISQTNLISLSPPA